MSNPVRSLFVASSFLASAASQAADPAAASPVEEQVIVTATRVPTPIEEVLAPVLVIDRADLERSGAADLTEVLRFHAGLDVTRSGGPGQPTAVFIRGAESNHTLVLVDGVRVNPGTIGLAALQNIPPAMIERIEVVKGPRSALYGTDAIGGVINVITRRGARDGWSAEVGYGDYDTRQASLNGGMGLGRTEIDFGVSWLDSDGFPTRTTDDTDRGFQNLSANLQLRANLGPASVALRHWRAEGTTEYSDFFLTPVDQDFENAATALEVAAPLAERLQARFTASRLDDRIRQNQSPDYLETKRETADAQFDWTFSTRQSFSAGVMYARERASSESYGDVLDADTDTLSLYAQDRIAVGAHRALLAIGYTDHETAGQETTWNVEYGYTLEGGTLLYALAGTGFRAPDATDRYGFGGNPGLDPERSRSLELGTRRRLADRHTLSLAAFRNDIEDLIEFVTTSYDPFEGENRNVEQARIDGLEASYEYSRSPWRARIEASYQDPRNRGTGDLLLRRARESLAASVSRTLGPVELGVDVLAVGDRKDFGFPSPVTLDGYVLTNLTARWQVTRTLSIAGRIENLFDERYELASTFNTPDRGVYVSLRYSPAGSGGAAYSASARSDRMEHSWVTD
ncbi:MAG: TonB-dependent receptor [Steroidobacteraceae bacterium]